MKGNKKRRKIVCGFFYLCFSRLSVCCFPVICHHSWVNESGYGSCCVCFPTGIGICHLWNVHGSTYPWKEDRLGCLLLAPSFVKIWFSCANYDQRKGQREDSLWGRLGFGFGLRPGLWPLSLGPRTRSGFGLWLRFRLWAVSWSAKL